MGRICLGLEGAVLLAEGSNLPEGGGIECLELRGGYTMGMNGGYVNVCEGQICYEMRGGYVRGRIS